MISILDLKSMGWEVKDSLLTWKLKEKASIIFSCLNHVIIDIAGELICMKKRINCPQVVPNV